MLLRACATWLRIPPTRPAMSSPAEATELLLNASRTGDRNAANELFTLLYVELRQLAHRQLCRARPGETLNTTALVHELYVKLMRGSNLCWEDRRHFLAVAAKVMRDLIVDHARRHAAVIHGGKVRHVPLDAEQIPSQVPIADLVALDEALQALDRLNERLSQVVELRYFGGLSVEETADVMNTSERTIKRDMRKARAFLQTRLG
jgi:RNA polymerase sigma factor (TIGR02999 family)